MPKIIICRGLVASGKSTWARSEVVNTGALRWNNDDFCEMLTGRTYGRLDGALLSRFRTDFLVAAVESGADVIFDNTNLNPHTTREIELVLDGQPHAGVDYTIEDRFFPVPLEESHRRNALRDVPVPGKVIDMMHKRWIASGHWPELKA